MMIFMMNFMMIASASGLTEDYGTCTLWGDPHLICFPVDPTQSDYREGYWCQWQGRILVVKNTFIQLYVNFTASPYWNEYYEIYLFYDEVKICTITPDIQDCDSSLINIVPPSRGAPNTKQIYYDYNENEHLEILVSSHWVNGRFVAYNIEVVQAYGLILNSTGLCVNRARRCEIESVGRRKRSTSISKATEACDLFINKSRDTARQLLPSSNSPMINHAREACITDILTTNDPSWGVSATWFVINDHVRHASLPRDQQKEILSQVPSLAAEIAAAVKSEVEGILETSTTTSSLNNDTSATETQTAITSASTIQSSSSQTLVTSTPSSTSTLKLSLALLSSMILVVIYM